MDYQWYLADGRSKQVNNALVWHGDHAVSVDLNDTMTHSHAAAFTDTTAKQTTYLHRSNT